MAQVTREQRDEVIKKFRYEGELIGVGTYGSGHINDTYLLVFETAKMGQVKVILQRMNRIVFERPVELMENITGVTSHLRKKITGGLISLLLMLPAMIRWKNQSIFTRVQWLSDIFRDFLRIIRQKHFMRQLKDFMIQRRVFKCLKRRWKKTA